MLKYDYINKEWIVSPVARRIYLVSAIISLLFFIGISAAVVQGGLPEIDPAIARTVVLIGALGAGITSVGMLYFLVRFDDSHPLKQVFWFCFMLLPLLGAPLYCFIVYCRSPILEPR
jgi:hypothetical protein